MYWKSGKVMTGIIGLLEICIYNFCCFYFKKKRTKEGKQKGREEGRERKIIDLTKCPLIGLHSVVSGSMGDWHASVLHERQQEGQLVRPFAVTGDPTW